MSVTGAWELLRDTVKEWWEDDAPRLGAAMAFYTLLSLAPLLVVVTAIAGMIFGEKAAEGRLVQEIENYVGPKGAETIQALLVNAAEPGAGLTATLISVGIMFVAASGVFAELQKALNVAWEAEARRAGGLLRAVKARFLTFVMVLLIGALLLTSLVASTALAALGRHAADLLPGSAQGLRLAEFAVSYGLLTVLFALTFKFLPDVPLAWEDAWVGGAVTALLFTAGKYLIGLYLATSTVASAYGAAGSLVAFLIWVYYSAQAFFLGAEFIQVRARRAGRPIGAAPGRAR